MQMMNSIYNNFGLSGQEQSAYDDFLCGRKCKARKKEKRKVRLERRRAKNDARKAENERVRAETKLLTQQAQPPAPTIVPATGVTMPMTQQHIAPPPANPSTPPQQAGMGNSTILIGLTVLVGIGFMMKNKGAQVAPQ